MKAIPWKTLLPVLVAVAVFYVLCLAYFSPMLEGKQLGQHDIRQYMGMSKEVSEFREATGEEALWTGSMFSGMPAYQISVVWSSNLLRWADKLFHGFLPRPAEFLFLYLVGMFVLLRILKVDPWLSLVGAIAFAFSSYFFIILPAGHTSKANAIGYMPLVLGAMWMVFRGRMLLGAALLALFLGLEIAMNHVQVTYYLGILLALFVLAEAVRAVRERTLVDFAKRSGVGMVGVMLALLCNLGLLWSTWEYGKYTTRGQSELTIRADGSSASDIRTAGLDRDYVTQYSYGKQESFTLLVPDAKGGPTAQIGNDPDVMTKADPRFRQNIAQMNHYWGDQYMTSGPVYVGAVVLLLMLLLLVGAETRARWWLGGSLLVLLACIAIANRLDDGGNALPVLGISAPIACGMLLFLYLAAGLYFVRDVLLYALFGAMLTTLMLAWGHNLMPLTDFFLDHVPGYNKFRAVTIILVVVELAVPVLGVLYLDRLIKAGGWDKLTEKRNLIGIGAVLVLLLAMAIAPDGLFDFVSDQEREAFTQQAESSPEMEDQVMSFVGALKEVRIGFFTADVWRSFAFVLAGGALLFLFGRRKVGRGVLLAGMGALILLDLWTVDKRYLNNEKARGRYAQWEDAAAHDLPFKPDAADKAILEAEWGPEAEADQKLAMERLRANNSGGAKGRVSAEAELVQRFSSLRPHADYRVFWLGNPFSDARTSYFHRSLGGYHGAKLKRYQELIEFHLGPARNRVSEMLSKPVSIPQIDSLLAREGVLNMLNTRYLIYSPERPPLRNVNALGAGWFVDEVRWAKDADEEITTLGTIDPATTAVVDERYRAALGDAKAADPSASVELTSYRTNELTYTVRSATGGVVVFSEIWYGPDWKASIDGAPAEHVRADYVLRAMAVPAGTHTVVFKIESRPYHASAPVAMASSGIVLLLALGLLLFEARRALRAA